jgi:hypothetical protein
VVEKEKKKEKNGIGCKIPKGVVAKMVYVIMNSIQVIYPIF